MKSLQNDSEIGMLLSRLLSFRRKAYMWAAKKNLKTVWDMGD